jgi:hypothetical protein
LRELVVRGHGMGEVINLKLGVPGRPRDNRARYVAVIVRIPLEARVIPGVPEPEEDGVGASELVDVEKAVKSELDLQLGWNRGDRIGDVVLEIGVQLAGACLGASGLEKRQKKRE